ncbi:hypothetical protein JYU34_003142 [Plutella xylostella]|uniref:Uncharacterized protein n=1 Tax=Plutella xylostella TaxID=51655 RepID=A0ABQ7QZA1_PLUXY|nr:hypothetical protein JYU34_003142 [Plutella xylostella]
MTLHWWMHWFWVTLLVTLFSSGWTAPQSEPISETIQDASPTPHEGRQGRAMYFAKTTLTPATKPPPALNITDHTPPFDQKPNITLSTNDTKEVNATEIVHPAFLAPDKSADANDQINNNTKTMTVTKTNNTVADNATVPPNKKRNNLTRHPEVKEIETNLEGAVESRIVTEKPLSLETAFLQTRIPPNVESSRRVIDQSERGMDTGEIAGISFAALVLVALAGSTAFVLYRRRYLNKPQTLNDKCSNPDSSGYLDDSTIRDNSEEMYSLDNDSFLNSLEAMTIQNYWTDTVKHTKL